MLSKDCTYYDYQSKIVSYYFYKRKVFSYLIKSFFDVNVDVDGLYDSHYFDSIILDVNNCYCIYGNTNFQLIIILNVEMQIDHL